MFSGKNIEFIGVISMGFVLKVEGPETIELGLESIIAVEYATDTPDDSNARSTDVGTLYGLKEKFLLQQMEIILMTR